MDAKITNSNENKANPGNYSTQGFTGDPKFVNKIILIMAMCFLKSTTEGDSLNRFLFCVFELKLVKGINFSITKWS